jgi:hypothetical protein
LSTSCVKSDSEIGVGFLGRAVIAGNEEMTIITGKGGDLI